jgi:hypothetical protein
MSLEELESEILRLPEEDRERLARSLLRTLEPDPEVEEALRSLRAMLG